MHFGYSLSASSDYYGWGQMRYGWCTDNPHDVSVEGSHNGVASADVELSGKVGDAAPYSDFLVSIHKTLIVWGGANGMVSYRFRDSGGHRSVSAFGSNLKSLDITVDAAAAGHCGSSVRRRRRFERANTNSIRQSLSNSIDRNHRVVSPKRTSFHEPNPRIRNCRK